jgi:diamine N-acetyltransferase
MTMQVDAPGPVSLREIKRDDLRQILALSVAPNQKEYVATNAESIAEAYFHPEAWFRGIWAGEKPVGFVMLEDWSLVEDAKPQPIFLWRFMIDERHQRHGIGAKALRLVVDHARTRTEFDEMLTAFVPGAEGPEAFYMKFGFERTGRTDGSEIVIRYKF